MASFDETWALPALGYTWLPSLRRREGGDAVRTRLLGRPAVGLCGPAAARFFYDEAHVRRAGAIPGAVQSTLFGRGAVHTLDGEAHRVRKALFLSVAAPAAVADLADRTARVWDTWPLDRRVVLFDEASRIITRAVCDWAGVPLAESAVPGLATDLTAMVDGFATLGPRHWRARRARGRREAWLADLVREVRDGSIGAPPGSALDVVVRHRDADGALLEPRLAAVELLNVLRPTVAVSWFVAFAGHALHRWPAERERLRTADGGYVTAFAHELRRFYPFAPFVAGRAVCDLSWGGVEIPTGAMVLLDIFGQHHDPRLFGDPYAFRPDRFVGRHIGPYDLLPQGGGDPATGHRCPGEGITVALLETLTPRLARLDYTVPEQDLSIPLHRVPTRPRSGFVLSGARHRQFTRAG